MRTKRLILGAGATLGAVVVIALAGLFAFAPDLLPLWATGETTADALGPEPTQVELAKLFFSLLGVR